MEGSGKVDSVCGSPYGSLDEDNEDAYAVVELGAENRPRNLLSKIHNFLYTATKDVRRAENGQYASGKAKEEVKSADLAKRWATLSTSAPSNSFGGLRKAIAAAIQAMQRYRKAARSTRFRELRDDESSAASKTTSTSSK